MKPQELMIGDWYANSDNDYCKVIRNFGKEVWGEGNDVSDSTDDPRPIPITEEILKLNGLESGKALYINNAIIRFDWVRDYFDDSTIYMVQIQSEVTSLTRRAIVSIKFFNVHELQHILRQCHLQELADNFKVK